MPEQCANLKRVAEMLDVSPRALDRRAQWSPPFPQPVRHRPLVWRAADVEAWIVRASVERNGELR